MNQSAEQILEWMQTRHSVRNFTDEQISHEILESLLQAASSAPSASNRQPWRFAVVTSATMRNSIAEAVRNRAEQIKNIIAQGHHAEDYGNYGDFFHEPLDSANVIIIPQFRLFPDLIANLIASGGADPTQFHTASSMQAERCSTSAAVMNLLLQAHAFGLGACWMSGPMIACEEISKLLTIRQPWQMLGAIALGYPAPPLPEPKPRKSLDNIAVWFDKD